jgi:hypothetical protein
LLLLPGQAHDNKSRDSNESPDSRSRYWAKSNKVE